jgi:hypothetical protein
MSKENWDDKSFVLEQVQKNSYALNYASKILKDDEEVVLTTVKRDGTALEFASDRLQDDKAIVLASVQNRGYALRYASDRLKDNKAVVLASVQNRGSALRFSSDRLRSDVNFCIECAKIDKNSSKYFMGEAKDLFEKYQNNPEAIQSFYAQQQAEKEQQQANEALLSKLTTGEIAIPTNKLFKRKLLDI